MKGIIYCFSGTGNTLRVCNSIASELKLKGIETEVFSITSDSYEKKNFSNPNEYDIIGIAYPIYGFNAPYLVNRFVKKLPKSKNGQKAFIIKTSGEPFKLNNFSSNAIKRYLKHKNYVLTYEKHYLMPYNIMFRYNDGLVKQMALYSNELAKVSADKIKNESVEIIRPTFLSLIASFICKLVWIGGPIIGKTYRISKKKCIKCGKCVNGCPKNNISFSSKGKIKVGGKCMLCCNCSMNCPTDAINMGIMNSWKVNKPYPFEKLLSDDSLSANFISKQTKGYFRKFNKYYDKIDCELVSYGIDPPRNKFEPNDYSLMTKRQKRAYNKKHKSKK